MRARLLPLRDDAMIFPWAIQTIVNRITLIGLVVGFCTLFPSCVHVGQRLLTVEIEVDGELAFRGLRGVRDDMPIPRMWTALDGVALHAAPDFVLLDVMRQAKSLTFDQDVVVRIKHVDRLLDEKSLPVLKLVATGDETWTFVDSSQLLAAESE